MNKVTLFAAAAAVGALVASPVMARDNVRSQSGAHMKSTKHQARMQNRTMSRDRMANRRNWNQNDWDRRDSGFVPGAVAGGIVGGAVGTAGAITAGAVNTAGAIATAPFGGTYDNGTYYNRGPVYGDAGGYPYGYRSRYGGAYASTDTMGWGNPGYGGGYGYTTYNYDGVAVAGSPNYDARNGFTCRPGSVTKNGVICQ